MKFGKVIKVWNLGTNLQFLKVQKILRDWIAKQNLELAFLLRRVYWPSAADGWVQRHGGADWADWVLTVPPLSMTGGARHSAE